MIAVIDYGNGPLTPVSVMPFTRLALRICVSKEAKVLEEADGLILPGVGAFRDCMQNLKNEGLVDVIRTQVQNKKPLLGICLGMQVLFEKGYEVKKHLGLAY